MARSKFFKIRSWHITNQKHHDSPWRALCGQTIRHTSEISEELDLNQKSCKICLRIDKNQREKHK